MARLIKRTSVEAPAPLPSRGKEEKEPDTYLCKGPETHTTKAESAPMLGMCIECNLFAAHREVDHFCLNCNRRKAGFEFDPEVKRFVKEKK